VKKLSKKSNRLKKAKRGQRKLDPSCVSPSMAVEQQARPLKSPPPERVESAVLTHAADAEVYTLIENHDEKGLSRAKAHWFFGEWQKLAELDETTLAQHPDRDRMALLVASAHQQLDDHDKAKKFSRMALAWGCPPRVAAQVLIAGVHNTLGKVAALREDAAGIERHFKDSVNIGSSRDTELVVHARSVKEMAQLGLLPQAASLIDEHIETAVSLTHDTSKQAAVLNLIKKEQQTIKIGLQKSQHTSNKNTYKRLIVIASMPRSGSTWLYNCVKQILSITNEEVYACWVEDYDPSNKTAVHIVKAHDPVPELADKADIILSTRRDIREVAASLVRMKWNKQGDKFIDQLNWITETVHQFWFKRTNLEIEYNNILNHKNTLIEDIGHLLNIHLNTMQIKNIEEKLNKTIPSAMYSKDTQLHPNHLSDRKYDPIDLLGSDLYLKINSDFKEWLFNFDYK
tara:strand:- start:5983 stop:7353 length:1371 start_codon:yes stop_codon:yes gene_type:complete